MQTGKKLSSLMSCQLICEGRWLATSWRMSLNSLTSSGWQQQLCGTPLSLSALTGFSCPACYLLNRHSPVTQGAVAICKSSFFCSCCYIAFSQCKLAVLYEGLTATAADKLLYNHVDIQCSVQQPKLHACPPSPSLHSQPLPSLP